jgi:RNA polymerase sigma-70 factor (ECF subfamily)
MSNAGVDLIRAIAEGDAEALAGLYDRYAPLIYPLVRRILADPDEAARCLEQIFWAARERAAGYDPERGSPEAWLVSLARGLAVERMRAARRRRDAGTLLAPANGDGVVALDRSVLARAFERLPDPQREALELAYYGGLTQTEITARLKQPLGTVKTRLRLALDRLREMVRPA